MDYWDIGASFGEKSYKCGYNRIDGGVELCFGISEYGQIDHKIAPDDESK